jgi:hypothetical protein
MRGEYLFVVEVVYADEEEQNERIILRTKEKEPLVDLPLVGDNFPTNVNNTTGLEINSDGRLGFFTASGYFEATLAHDWMLIDYTNKVLYFRENYTSVDVIVND